MVRIAGSLRLSLGCIPAFPLAVDIVIERGIGLHIVGIGLHWYKIWCCNSCYKFISTPTNDNSVILLAQPSMGVLHLVSNYFGGSQSCMCDCVNIPGVHTYMHTHTWTLTYA